MNKDSSYEFLRLFNRGYDKEEVSDPYYKKQKRPRIQNYSNIFQYHAYAYAANAMRTQPYGQTPSMPPNI